MIKNVLIIGLGGVGSVYASILSDVKTVDLKIFSSFDTLDKYKREVIINDISYNFDFITENTPEIFDLIIIAVKNYHLETILKYLNLFSNEQTLILSLLNGISSERIIQSYTKGNVILSYLICDSIIRKGNVVKHNSNNLIVLEENKIIEDFFDYAGVNYKISDNIITDLWEKFMLNIVANQLSAVTGMTFGEMQKIKNIRALLNNILREVVEIVKLEGINNSEKLKDNVLDKFMNMEAYGITSMLQDVENNNKTEVDAFAGEIKRLGLKYNIKTPYNDLFYFLLNNQKLSEMDSNHR